MLSDYNEESALPAGASYPFLQVNCITFLFPISKSESSINNLEKERNVATLSKLIMKMVEVLKFDLHYLFLRRQ